MMQHSLFNQNQDQLSASKRTGVDVAIESVLGMNESSTPELQSIRIAGETHNIQANNMAIRSNIEAIGQRPLSAADMDNRIYDSFAMSSDDDDDDSPLNGRRGVHPQNLLGQTGMAQTLIPQPLISLVGSAGGGLLQQNLQPGLSIQNLTQTQIAMPHTNMTQSVRPQQQIQPSASQSGILQTGLIHPTLPHSMMVPSGMTLAGIANHTLLQTGMGHIGLHHLMQAPAVPMNVDHTKRRRSTGSMYSVPESEDKGVARKKGSKSFTWNDRKVSAGAVTKQ